MAQPTYGTAFLAIRPDLKGFGTSLTQGITRGGLITGLGKSAGVSFGTAFIGGIAALGIGKAIAGQISSAIDESLKFESAFAGVRKTVDGTTQQLDTLRTGIIDMAKVLPASREEIAGVAEAAGQLGIQTENILDFTKVMIDLGETTNLTADQAATAFAQIANVMKTPQTAFENMASTLVDLGNKGASTESQIIDFALRIAGAGEIAGLAESDVLAIGSAMASVGVEAEAGGTAVQKVLLSITEAVATTNDDLDVFAETAGLTAQQFADAWREDAANAFALFVEGLGRAGDRAFLILDDLELKDQRLIRSFLSLSGAGDLLRNNLEIGSQAWLDNSAAAEEANKRYETSAARLEVVKNRATELQRQLGDQLVPIIVDLAENAIPSLENAFKDLTESIPGEADLLDFVNFVADLPRGIGQLVDGVQLGTQNLIGLVEATAGLFSFGAFGDVEGGLDRITDAFTEFGENAVFRTATQSLIESLRAGEEPALALANALAFMGRKGKIDPKVLRTLSQIADVDPSQLVLELERLVEFGPQLGLGADDIVTLRNALVDLEGPSIEAIRLQNSLASGVFETGEAFRAIPLERAESAFTKVFIAAAEADLSLQELVDGTDATGRAILSLLSPADQLALKLDLIGKGMVSAADAFNTELQPALVDITKGFGDLAATSEIGLDEFTQNLVEATQDFLDFQVNLAAIAGISPELAEALGQLPEEMRNEFAAKFADATPEEILAAAEGFLGSPKQLSNALLEIYVNAMDQVDARDPEAVDALLDNVADSVEAIGPGMTDILAAGFQPALNASFADLDPTTPAEALQNLVEASIGNMSASAITASLDPVLSASFGDAEIPDMTDQVTKSIRGWSASEIATEVETLFGGIDLNIDFTGLGREARATFFDGLSLEARDEAAQVRGSIKSVMDTALAKKSPPKLFLDYGAISADAFWSGFALSEANVFGTDSQKILSKIRQSTGSVSFGGESAGGPLVDTLNVYNPIGEPTEESVQSALLEVAISPVVNRLVSAGSST